LIEVVVCLIGVGAKKSLPLLGVLLASWVIPKPSILNPSPKEGEGLWIVDIFA